mmetsp:Transcript_96698/g.282669  ORF Transcript_96698/g.282669 Transcript_96698/m.282669 type:complete len:306 (+) Transcript_96698:401-1318(+)
MRPFTPSSAQWRTTVCTMGMSGSSVSCSILRMWPSVVFTSRQSVRVSMRRMTVKTACWAFLVCVSAEMPPKPRPTRLVSKYGRAILLATNMAARLEEQSGRSALGRARTSNTVMAMAKARQTAAQKAAAPKIANRAMKAPFASSETGVSGCICRSCSTNQAGIAIPMHRPSRPPIIIVGATTPAGLGSESAKIVMVHLKRKQRNMVQCGPSESIDHSWEFKMRSLSNRCERSAGCGLPPSRGKLAAQTVFTMTTTAIWKRSRHWHFRADEKLVVTMWNMPRAFPFGLSSKRLRASKFEFSMEICF